MAFIPPEAMPYFENMIYLPMVLVILEKDMGVVENSSFKLKRPYIKILKEAMKIAQDELKATTIYLRRNNMRVLRGKSDDTFTEYVFIHGGYEDHRRYLNVRLRNRTEELLTIYFAMTGA